MTPKAGSGRGSRPALPLLAGLAGLVLVHLALAASSLGVSSASSDPPEPAGPSTPTLRTVEATSGAAPGYVDDQVCGSCHRNLYEAFQDVGMARSFYPPEEARVIENFDAAPFFHDRSQRHYQMHREDDGGLRFRRYQLDGQGREINALELEVEWVLGSGNRSRIYLYKNDAGELYQLPLAWYTQGAGWAMAPGFDNPDHLGVGREVRQECMFCHNAYPEVPAGSDGHGSAQVFPEALPHGIGCQRCHGPGAQHVQEGFAEEVDFQALAASILDPADLEPSRRREVCYQCHLQPSVALMGLRRFGRGVYSYRPGEPLSDYLASVDIEVEDQPREERFEINHHPYRLEQSACFQASGGELSCLTCHDPHRKVPVEARAAHYREACLSCHQLDDCRLEAMAPTAPADGSGPVPPSAFGNIPPEDCASCHMPQRRSQDVIHAVMTDHRIGLPPSSDQEARALVAPLEESVPVIVDAEVLDVGVDGEGAIPSALAEIYRALTVLRAGGNQQAGRWLQARLEGSVPVDPEPYLDLARWQIRNRDLQAAEATLEAPLQAQMGTTKGLIMMTMVQAGLGRSQEALALARKALEHEPGRPELLFNLGRLLLQYEGSATAIPSLRRAVELRPTFASAWYYLGVALSFSSTNPGSTPGASPKAIEEISEEAAAAFRQALAIDPALTPAYLALARHLLATGLPDLRAEALRYLRHGARVAEDRDAVAALLQEVEASQAGEEVTGNPPPPASRR